MNDKADPSATDEKRAPEPEAEPIKGPKGWRASGLSSGIKRNGKPDLGLILSDRRATAAGVFTSNLFRGAPVTVCHNRLAEDPHAFGVVANSGCSNTCTGPEGIEDARAMADKAASAAGAEGRLLVASTGVIGPRLPMDVINPALARLAERASETGWLDFARSIMTTDTRPKLARRQFKGSFGRGPVVTVLGAAKGSGMIHPDMGTMLAFIVTDYPLGPAQARQMLGSAVEGSFNSVTVDGDTSTSDMALLLANGAALPARDADSTREGKFKAALGEVCEELAREIARDGEGARHLITIEVEGTQNDADAHRIARTIATSPLVKTAVFGNDPNWGRICCAAGYAGVMFDTTEFQLKLQGKGIMKNGVSLKFDRDGLAKALDVPDVLIQVRVGSGKGSARVWTCDFTYDYVKINAEYTS